MDNNTITIRIPGGHSYVETQGKIRVLDGEGFAGPVFYLDTTRVIITGRQSAIVAPLVGEDGSQSATPITVNEMLTLSQRYGMTIHTNEADYMAVDAESHR